MSVRLKGLSLAWSVGAVTAIGVAAPTVASTPARAVSVPAAGPTAYVTNSQSNSLSVYVGTRFVGTIQNVGNGPTGIAVNGAGTRAYVADYGFLDSPSHTVTPIDLVKGTPLAPITVGAGPLAIAIAPGDRVALVTLQGTASHPGHQVRAINLRTRTVSPPVTVGLNPESLAISPDGTTAYVPAFGSAEVTPLDLTTMPPRPLTPIPLPGTSPRAVAIAPDGQTAYVLDTTNATIVPINLPTHRVGQPVNLICRQQGDPGCTPSAVVISPDGRTVYVAAAGSADVIMLNLPSLTVAGVLQAGAYPDALGLAQGSLYVANGASDTMSIFTGIGAPRTVGGVIYPFGIAVVPGASTASRLASPAVGPGAAPRAGGAVGAGALGSLTPFYGVGAA